MHSPSGGTRRNHLVTEKNLEPGVEMGDRTSPRLAGGDTPVDATTRMVANGIGPGAALSAYGNGVINGYLDGDARRVIIRG